MDDANFPRTLDRAGYRLTEPGPMGVDLITLRSGQVTSADRQADARRHRPRHRRTA